ncbi:hypothetical protein Y1Q_0016338 [Alligator mississippiensis]|uniref:Uncharacterized protein n=1 Tax=Alligator mississippiensis TaxID=8496 RepID=A0A151N2T4_ALLMI|nr:hypothetical protein Y1Q_0016338 [Alligator mississippiensis]
MPTLKNWKRSFSSRPYGPAPKPWKESDCLLWALEKVLSKGSFQRGNIKFIVGEKEWSTAKACAICFGMPLKALWRGQNDTVSHERFLVFREELARLGYMPLDAISAPHSQLSGIPFQHEAIAMLSSQSKNRCSH